MFCLTPGGGQTSPQVGGWILFFGALKIFKSFWMDLKQNTVFLSSASKPKCNYLHSCNCTSKETWLLLEPQVHGEGTPAPAMSSASLLSASVETQDHCPTIWMTTVASWLTDCILQSKTWGMSAVFHQQMHLPLCYGLLCFFNVVLALSLQLHQVNPFPH